LHVQSSSPMGIMRLQVIIPAVSGLSEDAATNVWYAETPGTPNPTAAGDFAAGVVQVYKDIAINLSPLMSWSLMNFKAYDMAAPEPRVPIHAASMLFSGTVGVAALPTECACVLSFQGAPSSGVSQRRRRGRIYFGPLAVQSLNEPDGRLEVLLHQGLRTSANNLMVAGNAAASWTWCVCSQVTGTAVSTPVHNGWVDNAYDTQRRRGVKATTRSTFTT